MGNFSCTSKHRRRKMSENLPFFLRLPFNQMKLGWIGVENGKKRKNVWQWTIRWTRPNANKTHKPQTDTHNRMINYELHRNLVWSFLSSASIFKISSSLAQLFSSLSHICNPPSGTFSTLYFPWLFVWSSGSEHKVKIVANRTTKVEQKYPDKDEGSFFLIVESSKKQRETLFKGGSTKKSSKKW